MRGERKEAWKVENKDRKILIAIVLCILAVIFGIAIPSFLIDRNALIMQVILTSIFVAFTLYGILRWFLKDYTAIIDKLEESHYDYLTDAYNRRHFEKLFQASFQQECDGTKSCVLAYFDLDNLKETNDKYGHLAGDQMILTFSEVVQDYIRETDLFARYGGDEFIAVFFDINKSLVEHRIMKVKEQLHKSPIILHGNQKILIRFSYGIATSSENISELRKLIEIADQQMYKNKKKHKNTRAFYKN